MVLPLKGGDPSDLSVIAKVFESLVNARSLIIYQIMISVNLNQVLDQVIAL